MELFEYLKPDFSFSDTRGSLFQLVHTGYEQVNILTTKAGVVRGGHYHKETAEAFFVIEGMLEATLLVDHMQQTQMFRTGDFFRIPPFVFHTMKFIEDTVMVAIYEKAVEKPDGTKDIFTDYK